jgi:drug/metabolite transporter (DMT)-like permease
MGPLDLTILRNVISCLIFVAIFVGLNLKTRFRKGDVARCVLVGVLMTGVNYTFFLAISMNGVAVALMLQYTAPIFVIIFETALGQSRLTQQRVIIVAMAFAGCVLLVKGYDADSLHANFLGVVVGIVSGLVFGLYNMAVNVSQKRGVDDRALVLSSFVVSW